MNPVIPLCLLVLLFAVSAEAQVTSIYTSTKTNACRTIESSTENAGSYVGECKGPAGYKVQLLEGDIRQTLNVIAPNRKKFELDFWGIYSGFSYIGDKIEWRMKSGAPIALIARYYVADPEDSRKSTAYLMVSKIGTTVACVTDVVKPGPGQNEEARKLAESASTRACRKTE